MVSFVNRFQMMLADKGTRSSAWLNSSPWRRLRQRSFHEGHIDHLCTHLRFSAYICLCLSIYLCRLSFWLSGCISYYLSIGLAVSVLSCTLKWHFRYLESTCVGISFSTHLIYSLSPLYLSPSLSLSVSFQPLSLISLSLYLPFYLCLFLSLSLSLTLSPLHLTPYMPVCLPASLSSVGPICKNAKAIIPSFSLALYLSLSLPVHISRISL